MKQTLATVIMLVRNKAESGRDTVGKERYASRFAPGKRPSWLTDEHADVWLVFHDICFAVDDQVAGRAYRNMSPYQAAALGAITVGLRRTKAILALLEKGLTQDGMILLRSAWNNWLNIEYIRKTDEPEVQAQRYHDFFYAHKKKLIDNSERYNPGLIAPDKIAEVHSEFEAVAESLGERPRDWHGKTLRQLAQTIDRDDPDKSAEGEYDMFYARASSYEHCDAFVIEEFFFAHEEGAVPVTGARPASFMPLVATAVDILCRLYGLFCGAFELDSEGKVQNLVESFHALPFPAEDPSMKL